MNNDDLRAQFKALRMDEFVEIIDDPANPKDAIIQAKSAGDGICDFCSARPVVREFSTPDIEVIPPPDDVTGRRHMSVGGWGACAGCEEIVLRRDRNGLIDRSYTALVKKHGRNVGVKRSDIRTVQQAFWAAYEG